MAKAKLKVAQTASALPQKILRLRQLLSVIVLLAIVAPVYPFNPTQLNEQERQEWEQLIERFKQPRMRHLLADSMWNLTHGGDSKKVQEILHAFIAVDPRSSRRPAITTREYKNRIAAFLESDDDHVAGFAATLLAITGDLSFAPQIAKLLDKKDPEHPERYVHHITSRASAAYALSVLGAKEYVPKVALMLKSKNDYDRAGAATALGQFKAREYARDIAELLKPESSLLAGVASPIHGLMEMGAGAEYAAEFVSVIRRDSDEDMTEAAVFALVKLGDRQYAKEIAQLLSEEYRKADAAVALAIMGATEYTDEIARLLKDKDPLVRMAALNALGIMRATKYQREVARHLTDSDDRLNAAFALVLMDADRYARRVIPVVNHLYLGDLSLVDPQPFVEEELEQINNRFRTSFLRMKNLR